MLFSLCGLVCDDNIRVYGSVYNIDGTETSVYIMVMIWGVVTLFLDVLNLSPT